MYMAPNATFSVTCGGDHMASLQAMQQKGLEIGSTLTAQIPSDKAIIALAKEVLACEVWN